MLNKNKTLTKLTFNSYINQNILSKSNNKIKLRRKPLDSKKMKIFENLKNLNTDIIYKKGELILNLKKFNHKKYDIKTTRQSIGVNTSKNFDKFQTIYNKDNYHSERAKSKNNDNNDFNSSSFLYHKYFVGYNNKGEFIDNVKIKELRRNLKSFSSYQNKIYRNYSNKKNNKINNINNKNKGSLLTYNFNKNAYSNDQRLLISISNNNLLYDEKDNNNNKTKYKLKRQKTTINNYKSTICPYLSVKSMSNKNKKNGKFKQLHRSKYIYDKNKRGNMLSCRDINDNKKNNNIHLNIDINDNKVEDHKNNKDLDKKKELIKIIDNPNSLLNFVYNQIKELRQHKIMLVNNRKKALKQKFENMKNDLKQIEQKALYQVFNLRYERIPGNEINIKTNLFCTK